MKIGNLNKRVTIQGRVVTQSTTGMEIETWSDLDTVWACVQPIKGKEFWQAQQISSKLDMRVTIRYRSNVSTLNRLKYGNRYFDIVAVINTDERNRFLTLMCEEVETST